MNKETIYGASKIIEDAAEEITHLVDLGQDQLQEETKKRTERIKTLERVLGDFISFLEDPGDKPDLKTMAANLRRKMQ
nr:hypothetical protein [Desulfobacula sp.]